MSVAISISGRPEDIWLIKNTLYPWFADKVSEWSEFDAEVEYQLEMTRIVNGLSLDAFYKENPTLTIRLRDGMLCVAKQIVSGEVDGPGGIDLMVLFEELCDILDRFPESH